MEKHNSDDRTAYAMFRPLISVSYGLYQQRNKMRITQPLLSFIRNGSKRARETSPKMTSSKLPVGKMSGESNQSSPELRTLVSPSSVLVLSIWHRNVTSFYLSPIHTFAWPQAPHSPALASASLTSLFATQISCHK